MADTIPAGIDPREDRIVKVLVAELTKDGSDLPVSEETLAQLAALVLRTVRDDLALKAVHGLLPAHLQVEHALNRRILDLSQAERTVTGDTTEAGWPGFELVAG